MEARSFRLNAFGLLAVATLLAAACTPAAPAAQPTAAAAPKSAAVVPTVAPAAAASSADVASFYQGKTVTILVGLSAGGGFDVFARLLARYLPANLPGNPNVIVENRTGAGGLLAFNEAYTKEPKDGTSMVMSVGGLMVQELFKNPAVQFEGRKFNWVGAQVREAPACAARTDSGISQIADARTKEFVVGGTAPGSTQDDIPNILKNVTGLNIKLVSGYAGASAVKLAMESGEVQGTCLTLDGIRANFQSGLDSGQIKIIAQGSKTPHPDMPDVPLIRDLAQNDEQRMLLDAANQLTEYTRVFALPPDVPVERVEAMRAAFMKTLSDPTFLEEAKKARFSVDPVSGADLQKGMGELYALPPDLVEKLKVALTP